MFDHLFIAFRVVIGFKVRTEQTGNRLPEEGGKSAFVLFDEVVGCVACFPVDEADQQETL